MEPSPTVSIDGRAKELIASGVKVINFSAGEPDFPTPEPAKEGGRKAINENFTRYTPVAGTPDLRKAIAEKLERENGLNYAPSEIIVSNGGKQSLYNIFMTLCEPGDEVIIIAPYWVSYPEQVRLTGAKPVFVNAPAEKGFRVNREDLEPAVTDRTVGIVLNSPSNPTGAVLTRADLESIAELAIERNLWVVSDEIYEHLIYDGEEHVSIASFPGMRERTLIVNGMSKAYAMTGWRIGYVAGPEPIVKAMTDFQGHVTSAASSISQMAAIAALRGPQDGIAEMRAAYDERRRFVVEALNRLPGVRCDLPKGAFYVFFDVRGLLGEETGFAQDLDLAAYLLEEANVALVPGTGFGAPGFMRLSYATSMDDLREGMRRIEAALDKALRR